MLENMASRKLPRAMKASHELWSALCSGGIQAAAEPCAPFLVDILGISQPGVQSEILDILIKITARSDDETQSQRAQYIVQRLQRETRKLSKLIYSQDEFVAEKAKDLLDQLLSNGS